MKYKIWDRINKRYAENMTMSPDGVMLRDNGATPFDKDDFEVQWVKEKYDDLVDHAEGYRVNQYLTAPDNRKEEISTIVAELMSAVSALIGSARIAQDKLIDIARESANQKP
jgi:hypothetical protein